MNLLETALRALPSTSVQWKEATGRVQNERGMWITTYADEITISGSWQPVGKDRVKAFGLDEAKTYRTLYTSHKVKSVGAGASPDMILKDAEVWEVVGVTDWHSYDGWSGLILELK